MKGLHSCAWKYQVGLHRAHHCIVGKKVPNYAEDIRQLIKSLENLPLVHEVVNLSPEFGDRGMRKAFLFCNESVQIAASFLALLGSQGIGQHGETIKLDTKDMGFKLFLGHGNTCFT